MVESSDSIQIRSPYIMKLYLVQLASFILLNERKNDEYFSPPNAKAIRFEAWVGDSPSFVTKFTVSTLGTRLGIKDMRSLFRYILGKIFSCRRCKLKANRLVELNLQLVKAPVTAIYRGVLHLLEKSALNRISTEHLLLNIKIVYSAPALLPGSLT